MGQIGRIKATPNIPPSSQQQSTKVDQSTHIRIKKLKVNHDLI